MYARSDCSFQIISFNYLDLASAAAFSARNPASWQPWHAQPSTLSSTTFAYAGNLKNVKPSPWAKTNPETLTSRQLQGTFMNTTPTGASALRTEQSYDFWSDYKAGNRANPQPPPPPEITDTGYTGGGPTTAFPLVEERFREAAYVGLWQLHLPGELAARSTGQPLRGPPVRAAAAGAQAAGVAPGVALAAQPPAWWRQ